MSVQAPPSTAARRNAIELPAQIGKYLVRAKLGEGATSEVFLAHDAFNARDVAIKRVRPGLAMDTPEGHFQQHFFAAEAALVGRLHHPNVVQIYDAVDDAELPYLVMEYVPGVTLRRYCRADALLSLEQVVEIGFKCAMALGYVFRQGLIHRDVKPANILATTRNELVTDVKISDFGSVMNLQSERTQVFRVGSLAYMPPEQLDGDALDCRADIYALSGVLYHLIAGRAPFDATQQPALMHQIYHADAAPLHLLREGVPPRLSQLIARGLSKQRERPPRRLGKLRAGAVVAGGQWRGAARPAARGARLRALQPAALAGVLLRLRRRRVVGGGAPRRLAALRVRPCAVPAWRGGQQLPHHRAGPGGRVSRRPARGATRGRHLGGRDGLPGAEPGAAHPQRRRGGVGTGDHPVFHAADAGALGLGTRRLFDAAFIRVLVRRLHAAHEALAHPRRIL